MTVENKNAEIVKARIDKRNYRRILSIILFKFSSSVISIPIRFHFSLISCAASMSVGVSCFSDPAGLEGLAHFLEHMLFYASEK
ncbi:hypothetical protein TSUD_53120 [Trifolium subterraneum]|uniref:Peptidase M16 N-terminal domain-containing protein n=1 Tax=Trifolium subterraneum TaxID=3900 RepID=A0A2Z6N0V3_TRISU|nr:hypothetical protein TSUD_53120 [Trifolium subterraneum]